MVHVDPDFPGRPVGLAKVPQLAVAFWIAKVLTTGMGEAMSDFLAARDIPVAATIGGVGLLAALGWQLRIRRYFAPAYWLMVAMVAVVGTMAADVVHLVGVPYMWSSLLCALSLVTLFGAWRAREGTLSIHSINSRSRELFYWATVAATFALGTAVGDLTAIALSWGYLVSGLVFAALMVIPFAGWRWLRLNPVIAFWAAYILTRPLGASFADWLGKPAPRGGLSLGDGPVAAGGLLTIVALVVLSTVRPGTTGSATTISPEQGEPT